MWISHNFTAAIGSGGTGVARFYVRFATLPNAVCTLGGFIGGTSGFEFGAIFDSATNTIVAGRNASKGTGGVAVTTGVWYRIDIKSVFAATHAVDVSVDGVAVTQKTESVAAETSTALLVGCEGTTVTADLFIDDIVASSTSGDFPIGPGAVAGLYPNADGTHGGTWASGAFGKGTSAGSAAARTDTDIWQSLDNPLVATAAGSWVGDLTGSGLTDYVEFRNAAMPPYAGPIHGAMLVVTSHSASTTANNFNWDINDGAGHTATLISVVDLSETAITIPVVVRNTDANGVLWTPASIGTNRNRFAATDVNPDVYLDGFVWEVAYAQVARTVPVIVQQARNRAGTY